MKKILILLVLCVSFTSIAIAGCKTNGRANLMWANPDALRNTMKILKLSGKEAGDKAIQRCVENGDAFWIKKGTPITLIEDLGGITDLCYFDVMGEKLLGSRRAIDCDNSPNSADEAEIMIEQLKKEPSPQEVKEKVEAWMATTFHRELADAFAVTGPAPKNNGEAYSKWWNKRDSERKRIWEDVYKRGHRIINAVNGPDSN